MNKEIKQCLTCGELLVRLLESYQVNTVFGIPGVHTVELYRGLPSTNIRHITPRHEQGAGFMADGYARVSGQPGVCFIITGPGMTNIVTAMGQAYADSIPMLVISSVNRRHELGMAEGRLHELKNQSKLIEGVAAFSHTLMRPEELPAVLARAFNVFTGTRPRPVHIEIPIDVITAPAEQVKCPQPILASKPLPNDSQILTAAKQLISAKQPVILLGGGCLAVDSEAIVSLAEQLDAPTAYTINSKGVFPYDHPLALGCNQSLVPVREYIAKADVVLAIGTELGETDYDVVFDGGFTINGALIRIDIDSQQLHSNFAAQLAIISDAGAAVTALLQALVTLSHQATFSANSKGATATAAIREQLVADTPAQWRQQHRVLQTLQDCFPDVIIAGDSTQPVYSGNHLYETPYPRSWFNSSTGYGTLGYALPAAIGAKIASPSRPVVALIGDGGIQFTLPELASAVEAGAPIVILLWNNYGYGEIKHYMQRGGLPEIGVDIYTPDFQTLAKGFGCHSYVADSFESLHQLLQDSVNTDKPTLIEINEKASFLNEELS